MAKKSGLPTSNLNVKLSLKSGGVEVTGEGTITDLGKEISAMKGLLDLAAGGTPGSQIAEASEAASVSSTEFNAEAPVIRASKSTTENIRSLFGTPWGRTPRGVSDVMSALENNAIPDRIESVNMALLREVKRGFLRRLKRDGKWVYYKVPET